MKKITLFLVALFAFGFAANAQDALGLRFGGGSSYGAELSYQKGLGSNRLEFDLGMRLKSESNFFYLTGVYQWKGEITDWLGWFAGPGAKVSYCVNHGVGLALAQTQSERIGSIVDRRSQLLHLTFCLGTNIGMVLQCAAHRRRRNAQRASYIFYGYLMRLIHVISCMS